jgi:uncharacterized membrane protein YeiB
MVLVHADDLAGNPVGVFAPGWWDFIQGVVTNRARLLFFLLAGLGVSLVMRRANVGTAVLLRRALFLAVTGVLLVIWGWEDFVLVFYGVVFGLAIILVNLNARVLIAVATLVAAPGVLRLVINPTADDTLTNILLIVGEVIPLFGLGLVVGRANLSNRSVVRKVTATGTLLAVPGLVVLTATGGLDVSEVQGRFEPIAALTSTAGLCLVVLAGCLRLVPNKVGRWSPIIVAGSMPLSIYVGHALLFPLVDRVGDPNLTQSILVAVTYLTAVVAVSSPWRRRFGSGPLETLLRRFTGPHQSPSTCEPSGRPGQ